MQELGGKLVSGAITVETVKKERDCLLAAASLARPRVPRCSRKRPARSSARRAGKVANPSAAPPSASAQADVWDSASAAQEGPPEAGADAEELIMDFEGPGGSLLEDC